MGEKDTKKDHYLKAKDALISGQDACEALSIIYENYRPQVSIAYDWLSEEIETLLSEIKRLGQYL